MIPKTLACSKILLRLLLVASLVAQVVKHPPARQETWVPSWVGKIPWRMKWQPTLVSLPGKAHGQRSLAGYSPWDHKESDTTELLTVTMQTAQRSPLSSLHHFFLLEYNCFTMLC